MDVECHGAGRETENCIRMGGAVVKELGDGDGGCFGASCLSRCEGAECHQYGGVNCPRIVEKDADDLLQSCEFLGGQRWCGVVFLGVLDFGAISGCGPGVWCMLCAGCGLRLQGCDGAGYVAGHVDVACAGNVVPIEGEAAVEGAAPVGGYGVEQLEGVDEVLGVVVPDIFDPEIVDDKEESDGSSAVAEEAGSVGRDKVAMGVEVLGETFVGEDAGLR